MGEKELRVARKRRAYHMVMREIRLIVPVNDNVGRALDDLHQALCERLVSAYGGVTAKPATGRFLHPTTGAVMKEPVVDYTIAVADRRADIYLRLLAGWAAFAAEQNSIYLRLFDGTVEFVTAHVSEESNDEIRPANPAPMKPHAVVGFPMRNAAPARPANELKNGHHKKNDQ